MRLLCLHGVGSSGSICESQFGPFLKAVDPSHEFVFVDGPVPSERGPGMGAHLEGPFFSHTAGYSHDQMADALDHLEATIDELGPFDGVLGFSQGAALALSYLHEQQTRGEPAPFRFALFFSSVLPCSGDARQSQSVIQRLCARRWDMARSHSTDQQQFFTGDERAFVDLLLRVVIPAKKNNALLPDFDLNDLSEGGSGDRVPRALHPQLLSEQIRIPTVHVSGKRDFEFMRKMSETARGLCDERMMRKLEHSGSHHPPQKDAEVKAVVRAMEWAISQSERVNGVHL